MIILKNKKKYRKLIKLVKFINCNIYDKNLHNRTDKLLELYNVEKNSKIAYFGEGWG
jgi:hypothetical protein